MSLTKEKAINLTDGDPKKKILLFAAPMLLGNVFQEMYNAVDTLVVGKFDGATALGAVGAAGVPFMLINALSIGFSVGATILVGQYYGAKEKDTLRRISSTVLLVSILMGLVVTAAAYFLSPILLTLLNVPAGKLYDGALLYLQTIGFFMVPMIVYINMGGLLRGIGNARIPLIFLIICTVINIILDLVFVAVFHWGVFGVAIATGIAQLISAILVVGYIYWKVPELTPQKGELRIDGKLLRQTVKLGLPNAIQMGMTMIGIVLLQRLINAYGETVISAYSVGSKVNTFVQMPIMTISSTLSTYVAQNWGAGDEKRVHQGVKFCALFALAVAAVLSAVAVIFRHELISIFTQESDVDIIRVGGEFMVINCAPYVLMAMMNIVSSMLNGAGDTVFTMVVSIAVTLLRLPMAYFVTGSLNMDYKGIWLTFPITWVISLVVLFLRYRSGRWKKNIVGQHPAATE